VRRADGRQNAETRIARDAGDLEGDFIGVREHLAGPLDACVRVSRFQHDAAIVNVDVAAAAEWVLVRRLPAIQCLAVGE
jgi:hypothetical protein